MKLHQPPLIYPKCNVSAETITSVLEGISKGYQIKFKNQANGNLLRYTDAATELVKDIIQHFLNLNYNNMHLERAITKIKGKRKLTLHIEYTNDLHTFLADALVIGSAANEALAYIKKYGLIMGGSFLLPERLKENITLDNLIGLEVSDLELNENVERCYTSFSPNSYTDSYIYPQKDPLVTSAPESPLQTSSPASTSRGQKRKAEEEPGKLMDAIIKKERTGEYYKSPAI